MKQALKQKLTALSGVNPIPKVKTDADCIIEVRELLEKLYKSILDYKQDYGIKWIAGLEKYVEDKEDRATTKWVNDHYARGHIVEVELFGHFNKELTFAHPGVVLFDGTYEKNTGGWLLIAPISTPRFGDKNNFTVDVGTEDGLKHDSGVCVDAIQVIDKRRILFQHVLPNKNKSKLRPSKLDEIDLKVMEYYLPETFEKYTELDHLLTKEKADHDQTKKELEEQKQLNQDLTNELKKIRQSLQSLS